MSPNFKVGDKVKYIHVDAPDKKNPWAYDGDVVTIRELNGDVFWIVEFDNYGKDYTYFGLADAAWELVEEEETKANTSQVGGTHYQKTIQPWDYIVANNMGYLEGNIVKYITRYKDKNGLEDLMKAHHYLAKLIETYKENTHD